MKALDLMSSAPVTVAVTDSVSHAAELMRERVEELLERVSTPGLVGVGG